MSASTASPDMAPSGHMESAFAARALQRLCGGAHGLKDAEGIVGAAHAPPIFEGLRVPRVPHPTSASDSAAAAEGW